MHIIVFINYVFASGITFEDFTKMLLNRFIARTTTASGGDFLQTFVLFPTFYS